MSFRHPWIRNGLVAAVALGLMAVTWGFTRLPRLDDAERERLVERFAFDTAALPAPAGETRSLRPVHRSLEGISAWISSVGAGVALADLDGDGLPNDVCLVEVRTDRVVVAPVPGTGERYEPFTLEPDATPLGGGAGLPYERATSAPMGCIPGDLNQDGAQDVLVYYWGRTPVAFLGVTPAADEAVDGGDGASVSAPPFAAASFRPREVASTVERWFTNAATRADVDGDGRVDLVLGNYFQDGARILDPEDDEPQQMQDSMSHALNAGHNRIFLLAGGSGGPEPTVTFTEVEEPFSEPVARGWTLAVGTADLDGDLLPEIYFANDFGPDRLLHNRSTPGTVRLEVVEGRRGLTTVRSKILGRDSFKGMGVDFADVDGDGHLDIYVSNIAARWALEESHFLWISTGEPEAFAEGRAPYEDRSEPLGLSRSNWGWDSRLADFDNDGTPEAVQATGFVRGEVNRWPELHELAMANDEMVRRPMAWLRMQPGDDLSGYAHNPFFVRSEDGRFVDLAADLGLDRPQVSRGIATADVDADGRLDFAVANQWDDSFFHHNRSPDPGAYVALHLRLVPGASGATVRPGPPPPDLGGWPAVGAAVRLELPDDRVLVGQVDGGNGHSGVRSPELHFGLGDRSPAAVPVTVRWRGLDGAVHAETLELPPGWHTVTLGTTTPGTTTSSTTTSHAGPPTSASDDRLATSSGASLDDPTPDSGQES